MKQNGGPHAKFWSKQIKITRKQKMIRKNCKRTYYTVLRALFNKLNKKYTANVL